MSQKTMPFGKFKGQKIESLPRYYVSWLWKQDWLSDWLRDAVGEASSKWTNIKYHSTADGGWTGWFNPVTRRGGSISGRATGRVLY